MTSNVIIILELCGTIKPEGLNKNNSQAIGCIVIEPNS